MDLRLSKLKHYFIMSIRGINAQIDEMCIKLLSPQRVRYRLAMLIVRNNTSKSTNRGFIPAIITQYDIPKYYQVM